MVFRSTSPLYRGLPPEVQYAHPKNGLTPPLYLLAISADHRAHAVGMLRCDRSWAEKHHSVIVGQAVVSADAAAASVLRLRRIVVSPPCAGNFRISLVIFYAQGQHLFRAAPQQIHPALRSCAHSNSRARKAFGLFTRASQTSRQRSDGDGATFSADWEDIRHGAGGVIAGTLMTEK